MSFGDYSKSNFDSIQKPDKTPKETKVENQSEVSNDSEQDNNDISETTTKPIVQNNVQVYKEDSGDPKLLDFGIFDYKNNQQSLPEQLKDDDFESENNNSGIGKFQDVSANVQSPNEDYLRPILCETDEAKASLEIVKGMQKALDSMK